jgi:flagellar biosynthesis chaperone FliJ
VQRIALPDTSRRTVVNQRKLANIDRELTSLRNEQRGQIAWRDHAEESLESLRSSLRHKRRELDHLGQYPASLTAKRNTQAQIDALASTIDQRLREIEAAKKRIGRRSRAIERKERQRSRLQGG